MALCLIFPTARQLSLSLAQLNCQQMWWTIILTTVIWREENTHVTGNIGGTKECCVFCPFCSSWHARLPDWWVCFLSSKQSGVLKRQVTHPTSCLALDCKNQFYNINFEVHTHPWGFLKNSRKMPGFLEKRIGKNPPNRAEPGALYPAPIVKMLPSSHSFSHWSMRHFLLI